MLIALGIVLLVLLPLVLYFIWFKSGWEVLLKLGSTFVFLVVWIVLMFGDFGLE